MKVIGIKGNYNASEKAQVYLMADSSLLKDGKPLFLPDFAKEFIAYPALVVKINRLGKNIAKRFASRYYDAVTVGLCVEAHDFSNNAKIAGTASIVNAFDGAAILGDFIPIENYDLTSNHIINISSTSGDNIELNTADMILDIDSLVEELSKYYTFKIGDILFTGYKPELGIKLSINDNIIGKLDNNELLHFKIK